MQKIEMHSISLHEQAITGFLNERSSIIGWLTFCIRTAFIARRILTRTEKNVAIDASVRYSKKVSSTARPSIMLKPNCWKSQHIIMPREVPLMFSITQYSSSLFFWLLGGKFYLNRQKMLSMFITLPINTVRTYRNGRMNCESCGLAFRVISKPLHFKSELCILTFTFNS